jgi:tetratricopeptide (TPR) repeat protein
MKGTMIGVAPPLRPVAPPRPPPAAEPLALDDLPVAVAPGPAARDPFADLDLPAVVAKPLSGPDAPAPAPQVATSARPAVKPPLPAKSPTMPRAPLPKPARPSAFDEADLPAPLAPKPTSTAVAPRATATASPRATLPRPGAPRPAAPTAVAPPIEADLPSPRAPEPPGRAPFDSLDLPERVRAESDSARTRRVRVDEAILASSRPSDLPVPVAPRAGVRDPITSKITLPTAGGRGVAAEADLDIDLPSPVSGVDLPSPIQADLPTLSGGVGLPAVVQHHSGGFGELDLPMIGAELPSPAAGLPSHAAAGLPSPVAAGLPSPVAAGLPSLAAGLPSPAAQLPSPASLPPFGDDDDPFGSNAPFSAPPISDRDPFGSSGHDPFGDAGPDPFSGANAFGNAESDLDASGATARFGTPSASLAPTPFSIPPRASGGFDASGDVDYAPSDIPPPPEPARIVRQQGGGVAYGEVNLGGGDDSDEAAIEGDLSEAPPASVGAPNSGSGAEFDGLPTEATQAPAVTRERGDASAGSAVAEIQSRRRKKRLRAVVATVVATALVGGALTLIPSVGPFGAYFIVDQVRSGEYERLLTGASDSAHGALGLDTYPDSARAADAVAGAASSARRYKPLAAYSAFVGFARMLRFGSDPETYAHSKVALEELTGGSDVDKLELAKATRAAVDGETAAARELLTALQQKAPKDIDAAVVRGEVELRAKDPAGAVAAWTLAKDIEKSARTSYGLARAEFAANKVPEAQKLVDETLAQNPKHVGARFLSAEILWATKRDDPGASKLLDDILKVPAAAGPEERIDALTLLGQIHLNRGRISQAEQSFGDAIKIAEVIKTNAKASRALSGLGEALFRAARYSQAIARFKAAVQADPDDVVAQVGVAKSSLELERLEDARDMLTKLHKNYPKDAQVSYWYGRAEDALGDRKEAETAYREAITLGKSDPDAVQAYIALAGVQSQIGQLDAANETLADAQKHLPESPALFKALGRLAMTQGRYADGKAAFEKSLSLDPEDLEAKFLVGSALTRLHEFDRALEIFEAVSKVDRDFPGLALERGILYQESGRTEEALREYEGALAKAPTDPDLMLKVGCGKAAAGNGVEAEKMLRKVLEQRQSSAETHYCLGRALMAKQNVTDALKAFEQAVQIDPNRAEYYLYVGWASNEAGNITKATAALTKALALDQGLADAYWQRGVLRVRTTRSKDAVEDLQKALQLRPSRFEAHADLALAYNDLGKEDLALAEWQKAIAAKPDVATWRFHYGKLLSLRLQNAAAAEQLEKAIELSEAKGSPDAWLSEAHRLAAQALGAVPASIPHWQAFLKTGAADSPYRAEAKAALKRLGAPWSDE